MSDKRKLEIGEKFLSIKLIGHDFVVAFPNKNKKKDDEPDFKGDGIAVWVRKKKAEVVKVKDSLE